MLTKRIIPILLSTIIIVGTFIGCGNDSSTGTDAGTKQEENSGDSNKQEFNWIEEILTTTNRSKNLEKYMRNPDELKSEKFICSLEVIDVKTNEKGSQTIYGRVLEPYQFSYNYEEYFDDNIKYVYINYDPNEFDGTRVLKDDILAFSGLYSTIYSDTIGNERKEAPLFEADVRLSFSDYINTIALDKFMSSMGQTVNDLGLVHVEDDDATFNTLLDQEENIYYKEDEAISYYKDKNDIYWLLSFQGAFQASDCGVAIYVANKDSDGNYKIEYKSTVEFQQLDF